MFQPFYENINIILWIILGLVIFCILLFFLMGIVIKKRGVMCFETLLIGEEYLFSFLSSVVIYLIFSFPVAVVFWLFTYFSMFFVFKKTRKLLGFISYYENGKRKTAITKEQTQIYTQLDHWFNASQVFSWITDVRKLKNEVLCKIDCEIDHHRLCFKDRMVPFSCFASGTFGIGTAFFVYGDLIQNKNSFIAILIENYALVSCLLFGLYWIVYFTDVINTWGSFYGDKTLYRVLFTICAVFAYIAVTYISSMNWNLQNNGDIHYLSTSPPF